MTLRPLGENLNGTCISFTRPRRRINGTVRVNESRAYMHTAVCCSSPDTRHQYALATNSISRPVKFRAHEPTNSNVIPPVWRIRCPSEIRGRANVYLEIHNRAGTSENYTCTRPSATISWLNLLIRFTFRPLAISARYICVYAFSSPSVRTFRIILS